MPERCSIQPIRINQTRQALFVMESLLKEIWNISLKDIEKGNKLEDFKNLLVDYFEPGG